MEGNDGIIFLRKRGLIIIFLFVGFWFLGVGLW